MSASSAFPSNTPPPDLDVPSRLSGEKPYEAPAIEDFGLVAAITAGPMSGTLDQLAGSSGGFLPDGTS